MKLLAVYTTVATAEEARSMARTLVERQLAACAQISQIDSVYTWQGAVQQSPEYRVLFKTTATQYPALEAAILALHSYNLPAIYAVGFEHAFEPFAAWVQSCSMGTS